MKKVYEGKTKDVYELENGNYELKFKDTVTGKDGVFDPGENQVGLTMDGAGDANLKLTKFFFELLNKRGIPTHYVNCDIENKTMEVIAAKPFGKGLEAICRYKAVGSYLRRYGLYIKEKTDLPGFVEITIKDDKAGDPPISPESLEILGITSLEETKMLYKLTKDISDIIKEVLAEKDLELYDIKLEFGRDKEGNVILIDEISGGNMRVYRKDEYIDPLRLPSLLLD